MRCGNGWSLGEPEKNGIVDLLRMKEMYFSIEKKQPGLLLSELEKNC